MKIPHLDNEVEVPIKFQSDFAEDNNVAVKGTLTSKYLGQYAST